MTRILIADDIAANLYLLETILKANGFEVLSARNGSEALTLAGREHPDLIITDIMMPVMDGFELCRRVKEGPGTRHIPLIFYTSTYTEKRDEEFSKSLGVNRFVIKPQKPDSLIRIVREVMEESRDGKCDPAGKPPEDEMELLRQYNEVLFHKLEKKMHQLEEEIAERKAAQEQLSRLNEDLEMRVTERTAQLNKSLSEKEMLLKEIHHRVKNNLQIVASLLHIQARQVTDPAILALLDESQNRIKAMALVHERLYRSDDISSIDMGDYATFMGTNLLHFHNIGAAQVRFRVGMPDIHLDINRAIPLGLLINELISNALKHAFPAGRKGELTITGEKEGATLRVIVSDNGVGIPPTLDWKNTSSLGLRLVNSLAEQLNGTIELDRTQGTSFRITVPPPPPSRGT